MYFLCFIITWDLYVKLWLSIDLHCPW